MCVGLRVLFGADAFGLCFGLDFGADGCGLGYGVPLLLFGFTSLHLCFFSLYIYLYICIHLVCIFFSVFIYICV